MLCTSGIPFDPEIGECDAISWGSGGSAGTPSVGLSHKSEPACYYMDRISMSHLTLLSTVLPLSALSDTSVIVLTGIILSRSGPQGLSLTL